MTLPTVRPSPGPGPENTPRLRLKPKAPASGYVDGAWWPHCRELLDELPDLLAVLSVRLGPIERVIYNLAEWNHAPRKFSTGGVVVRLGGYTRQPVDTVEIIGRNRGTIHLLVVPSESILEGTRRVHASIRAPCCSRPGRR